MSEHNSVINIPQRGIERKIWYNQIYLRSEHWQEMLLLYKQPYCEMCGYSKMLALHHTTYDNLGNEKPEDFVTLCRLCHKASHSHVKENKKLKNPSEGLAKLARRIRNRNKPEKERFSQYLRRRYIAQHGDTQLPSMHIFRKFFILYIRGKRFPYDGSIYTNLDTFVKSALEVG